jgi:CHAD domain-containing protein
MGPAPADVLNDRLRALAAEVRRTDAMVADGEPEGVHDLRVALRRTRSLLRSFRPLLAEQRRAEAERLRDEARWAGGVLGPVRDAEVMHERLATLLEEQPAELVLGRVAARLADRARQDTRDGRERIEGLRADPRQERLLDDLEVFATGSPFAEVDETAVRRRLRKEWRRLRRHARAADAHPAGSQAAEAALHETRKAAKRGRYAVEAALPLLGEEAVGTAALAEQVQDALGAHRDTLLTRALLRELGVQAHLDGDNGFTFGRLHALEEARGAASLDAYRALRPELDRKKHRRVVSTGS